MQLTVKFFAQLRTQHVQHPASFLVNEVIELFHRPVVFAEDDRLIVIRDPGDAPGAAIKSVKHRVASVFLFVIEQGVKCGEPFVEPEMAPILAGDEVAEPLMRQFVRDESFAVADIFGLVPEKGPVRQGRDARVFHPAHHEIAHHDLKIFGPGIRHADFLFKKRHHVLRVAKGVLGFADFRRRCVKGERDIFVTVFDLLEMPGDEGEQIIDVRLVLHPAHGGQTVWPFFLGNLFSVGEHRHPVRHMANDLGGEFFVGRIEARIPMARFDRFALGPQMRFVGFITHLRRPEIKSLRGFRRIGDRHARLLSRRDGIGEMDDDIFVR